MFYSKDILLRKDNSLGLIWLAGTMGSQRSGVNKLSKKELNAVNIIKTCKDISQPPEPFALRFSSSLMIGVTRVYGQQYNFYYSDVNSTWMRLKRDLAVLRSDNVDMTNPAAKMDLITFDYDLAVEQDILKPLKIVQDMDLEVARHSRGRELAVELGWATQSTTDLRDSRSEDSPSLDNLLLMPASDQRRRNITLDERPMTGGLYSTLGSGGGFGLNVADDALVGEDSGLFIDSEGNLVDNALTSGIDDLLEESLAPQAPSSSDVFGLRKRYGYDAEHLPEIENDAAPGEQGPFNEYPLQDHGQHTEAYPQLAVAIVPQKRPLTEERQRKPSRLIIDDHTMLSREEALESRDNFLNRQTALIREREFKQMVFSAKARIESLFSRPMCVKSYGSDLAVFWASASERTTGLHSTTLQNMASMQGSGKVDDDPLLFDTDREFDVMNEPPEPEDIRRRQVSVDRTATPVDLGGSSIDLGSISSSRHTGHMPWSGDRRTSHGIHSEHSSTGSDILRRQFEAAFDPVRGRSEQRLRRDLGASGSSVGIENLEEEPLIRRRRHGFGQPRSRSLSWDTSQGQSRQRVDGGGPGSSMDAHDLFMDMGGLAESEVELQKEVLGGTQDQIAVEKETVNFLEYVRSMLPKGNTMSFSFADVVSAHRRRNVVVSAFYHVLALSTMGRMRPTQETPFQDIHIELIE